MNDLDLIPGHENSPDPRQPRFQSKSGGKLKRNEKMADYARSKRAVEMRITDGMNEEVASLDEENTELIQELNRQLVELDRINEDKRDLNN